MNERIIELLWLFHEEMLLDEDNKDAVVYEYSERMLDVIDDDANVFYPEHIHYID